MFTAASVALIIAMILALVRAFAGPTLYDRLLAGNSFGTKTVLLIGVMGFLTGRPDFLDIALVYALINFVGTIAILKFFRYRTLAKPMDGLGDELVEPQQFQIDVPSELSSVALPGAPVKPGDKVHT